jgi:hypothetical protein
MPYDLMNGYMLGRLRGVLVCIPQDLKKGLGSRLDSNPPILKNSTNAQKCIGSYAYRGIRKIPPRKHHRHMPLPGRFPSPTGHVWRTCNFVDCFSQCRDPPRLRMICDESWTNKYDLRYLETTRKAGSHLNWDKHDSKHEREKLFDHAPGAQSLGMILLVQRKVG